MRRALALCLLAVCVASCGGGSSQGGTPDVPSDWEAVEQDGVRFSLPPGAEANPPRETDNSKSVSYGAGEDLAISLTFRPGGGDAFDTFPSQYRAVIEGIGGGEVSGQKAVEVEGADEAYLLSGKGGDGGDVASLGVRKGADAWVLTARAKDGADVDPATITGSLRVGG